MSWLGGIFLTLGAVSLFFISMLYPPPGIYLPGIRFKYTGVFTIPKTEANAPFLPRLRHKHSPVLVQKIGKGGKKTQSQQHCGDKIAKAAPNQPPEHHQGQERRGRREPEWTKSLSGGKGCMCFSGGHICAMWSARRAGRLPVPHGMGGQLPLYFPLQPGNDPLRRQGPVPAVMPEP